MSMSRIQQKQTTDSRNGQGVGARNFSTKRKNSSNVARTSENQSSSQKAQESTSEKYRPKKIWFDGVPHALIKASCEDTTDPILVKSKSFSGLTRTIALDCEFVGVGYEGRDDALARVSVVNQFGHILLDEYVRPREKVIDYRTPFSGVTPHHLRKGGPAKNFNTVQTQVAKLCKDRILVGHAVHNDLKVLMLSHPKRDIRDTSRYRPFRDLFNGRYPSLKALTERVLGVGVQQGEHDSVEDARATMRLYTIVKKIWEAQVKAHRAGKSSKEIQRLSHHLHFPSAINETNEQKPKVEPTRLAKIALDVSSEFMPGIPHTNGTPKTGMQRKPDSLVSIDKRPRQVAMVNGRKCSKHRQRFLEKRRRIRQRKLVTSSKKRPSLFS